VTTARRPRRQKRSAATLAARYDVVALVLQGGGALGAYQAGVYEALQEGGIEPTWFAGVSIGAINAAILAGNPAERRIERLREFWQQVVRPASPLAWPGMLVREALTQWPADPSLTQWNSAMAAADALAHGQDGFFRARRTPAFAEPPGSAAATSFYDTSPLRDTLERLVDFDRIAAGEVRLAVGATHVRSGNVVWFDSATTRIGPEHIMASGALPPAFPAIEIDGEHYWDGGVVSNTPLQYVLETEPRRDTLALQVDLWSARGQLPKTLLDVFERQKDIQYSSRTRLGTDAVARQQTLRAALTELVKRVPADGLPAGLLDDLAPWLCDRVYNIVHLIYRAKAHEEQYKDYAFSPLAMNGHWASGADDMRKTLRHPDWFEPPSREVGVATHDVHRTEPRASARPVRRVTRG
jgi:NTE family protein